MGRYPQELIDQILDRVDIVDIISGYIGLKRAGRNFKSNCPFHNEKTPSFVVSPEKQIYHCFGCGAGGNAIGFVMKYENLTFPETITILANKAGVELPNLNKLSSQEESITARLYEVNKLATEFFQAGLKSGEGKTAQIYLKARDISFESVKRFKIGYALSGWDNFLKYCNKKKIPIEVLRKAGLIIRGEKGDYDRFRKRIIFPIFNERGNISAFGGRVMDESLPKYINSPETSIYVKSNVLYGLNFSKKGIRENGCAIIVEGYLDVIVPFQFGITNVVAASGTALTSRQARMLKKYTDTAVMVFDSDQAGEAASLRGLDILIENGMKVRIARLPEGEDPDSYIRKNGKEKFDILINGAKELFEYKIELLIEKFGANSVGDIAVEMLPTISKVGNAVVKADYIRRLAGYLRVPENSLHQELGKVKTDYSHKSLLKAETKKKKSIYIKSELHLLGLAVSDINVFRLIQQELGLDKFRDETVKKVLNIIGDFFEKGIIDITPSKILARIQDDEDANAVFLEALKTAEITEEPLKAASECIAYALKENKKTALSELTYQLKKAQAINDSSAIKDLVLKLNKLYKEKVM
ncbi:MAG: DNA primase [Candidatus Omnitrophota bacterium]|nr:DNA primase [Candidatus Omnitrophota bacterium]MBU1894479.1 DNA primase [Candidatus Omnitrophota bacterium]